MRLAGSYTIAKALKTAREDPSVRAVVLRIESPGGSSMAAEVIWREAELTARAKPLIVSMGTVAASGGYYAAMPGKLIFATAYTTTGSIGIFYGKADIAQLLTKVGITIETTRTAPHADAESLYRPFTDDEKKLLGDKIKQFYDVFIDRVSRGRHMGPAQVDAVARGRVWMGRQALAHKLVDRIGGVRQALTEARILAGLEDDCPVVELPVPENSLLDIVANAAGLRASSEELRATIPAQVLIYDPDKPLALMEIADAP
jgi:protease-4